MRGRVARHQLHVRRHPDDLPGEVAPVHRHVSSAIRFVLDGEGAYTAVEGEKAYMSPGDFVITANWAPHDHGNPSKKPMLWLDVLDFPAVNFYEASFADYSGRRDAEHRPAGRRFADLYASGVLPDGAPASSTAAPSINYTYARTRPILDRLKKSGAVDARHGARVRYANPINGGRSCRPWGRTGAAAEGLQGRNYRSTDGTIFVCAEGRGATKVGDTNVRMEPNDIFVVPPWKPFHPQRRQGGGAVLDLRPAGAGSARHLARGQKRELTRLYVRGR